MAASYGAWLDEVREAFSFYQYARFLSSSSVSEFFISFLFFL